MHSMIRKQPSKIGQGTEWHFNTQACRCSNPLRHSTLKCMRLISSGYPGHDSGHQQLSYWTWHSWPQSSHNNWFRLSPLSQQAVLKHKMFESSHLWHWIVATARNMPYIFASKTSDMLWYLTAAVCQLPVGAWWGIWTGLSLVQPIAYHPFAGCGSSYYPNHNWLIVSWMHRNIFHCNLNQTSHFSLRKMHLKCRLPTVDRFVQA